MLDRRPRCHTLLIVCSSPRVRACGHARMLRFVRAITATAARVTIAALFMLAALGAPCFADGPPPRSLVPADSLRGTAPTSDAAARSDSSAALAQIEAESYRDQRTGGGTHGTLRKVAVAATIGFAAAAIWRETVADDREDDYDQAILSSSAVEYRESVRDAERQRNALALLSAAGLSVVVWTLVY